MPTNNYSNYSLRWNVPPKWIAVGIPNLFHLKKEVSHQPLSICIDFATKIYFFDFFKFPLILRPIFFVKFYLLKIKRFHFSRLKHTIRSRKWMNWNEVWPHKNSEHQTHSDYRELGFGVFWIGFIDFSASRGQSNLFRTNNKSLVPDIDQSDVVQ